MRIVGLQAENVKRIKVVEIEPKSGLVQITGKNAQGKTSVLDAIWYALAGKRALPEKPVRKGAEKARIKLDLGELVVTRTIAASGAMTLTVESDKGGKLATPQSVLDELLGALTFDPLAFTRMSAKDQAKALRGVVKVDLDFEAMSADNDRDFMLRREINREVDRLRAEANTILVQDGLPVARIDETPLLQQMHEAGAKNEEARKLDEARNRLERVLSTRIAEIYSGEQAIASMDDTIARLKQQLAEAEARRESLIEHQHTAQDLMAEAKEAFEAAPAGVLIDVSKLAEALGEAQLTNREIDKRSRREALEKTLKDKERESQAYTRAMEDREEKKRSAIANAALPIDGLSFDEEGVFMHGIPLAQLGEAEQIRISASIAMSANPKLRIMLIQHGEALDDDGLATLAEMAEEHDFQIWMSRVDSSGKVGVVMEDGLVKEVNE